ncbi:PadR family transcriptional regulator [Streptacidiphilus sp. 4-A2]|nr:PadR family transcriptional regulator [Streptacidiphilus sp. 4-A2]
MSLRHAMLGLLGVGPASGYDLIAAFNSTLANVWPATQSQVYRELASLTEDGLLEVSAEGPRGRKEYSITEDGRTELVHWLAETEPNRVRRSETLLRVFFLGNLTHEQATDYLRQEAEITRQRLAMLRTIEESADWEADDVSIHGHLALEYGHRLMALNIEWSEWAIEQLDARQARGTGA